MRREELTDYLNGMLAVERFRDYCPNGLQVEGREEIRRVVCGVTANLALIEAAIERGADALLVHHGWFWKGEDGRITGFRKERLKRLLAHDINLIAYHLPLDAHPEVGNNAQLALRFGWTIDGHFGAQELGCRAVLPAPSFAADLAAQVARALGRAPLMIGEAAQEVRTVAWCSGGAQDWFEAAIAAGADLFLSGEISEHSVHLARESGVAYLAAGHHATERYGVMALGRHLAERFGLECEFVEIDNPV
ncbi:Nif3-like dinuclear metal center hexameric protein [Sulfuricystis multivorans]|uniref:Nif3-like dinuclear metal center hexameric protein n=1 Tax=Sulfuricystis multivorans TaxID=2211108 RepID=UPI000F82E65E|nr:Nif3-like dinuclear metal center hexameric protein [Sulfuricystis multivorans]